MKARLTRLQYCACGRLTRMTLGSAQIRSSSADSLQKLPFHFWIVLAIGLPRTVRRLLVTFADLLIEIVRRRHLLPFGRGLNVHRSMYREIGI